MAAPAVPTPRYEHVGPRGRFRDVYEPAEDTFLLLDALERDAAQLRQAGYARQAAVEKARWGTCRYTALAAGGARVRHQKAHPGFSVFRIDICLEIGSGSGVVSAFLASIIGASALYL